MNTKFKGIIYGIVAAISYGTNPLGALSLYEEGINANSVLFYRFSLAAIILGGILLVQKKSLSVTKKELAILAGLGILFGISSLTLFTSFHYMDAGIASTLLFVYPVMVAVIMAVFFKEKISAVTAASIALALAGIGLLYQNDGGTTLSTTGVILVMMSSLTYAIYIIVVNKSSLLLSSVKLTFYVLIFCMLTIAAHSLTNQNNHLQLLTTPSMWMWAVMLALVPTIISLIMMVKAVHIIGSTPTAIMGALEPLTAVIIGVTVFGELFTARLAAGIIMILIAVLLIIAGKSFEPKKLVVSINSNAKRVFKKYFRWK
ncbi:MAG TPA: EamA family transporter [Dysgonomonas sp.]|nr:EamA family transporter [Dysgonomonas sp.]